jgi:hypothetical protein
MPQYTRLQEERRTKRRTVADALDVVRRVFGLEDPPRGRIMVTPLGLPSGWTALVDVIFPDLERIVSLPTSLLSFGPAAERVRRIIRLKSRASTAPR